MYRVLLVDDEFYVRAMMRRVVGWEALGFEIVGEAEDGEDALEKMRQLVPDVVVADIEMPFLDGLELSRRISEEQPRIRMLFLTCYDRFEYARTAIRYGVEDYLLKPVAPQELERVLRKIRARLDQEAQVMSQSLWSISALSLIQEELRRRLSARNVEQLGEFLRNTYKSTGRSDVLCSREAITGILLDGLEAYCQDEGVPFERPDPSIEPEELIRLALRKACNLGQDAGERLEAIVRDAQNYVTKHCADPDISLGVIARGIFVNASYLSRVYNQVTGESISTFIRDVRLSRAMKLLQGGAQNVELVADEVGFRNAGYFSRCFKDKFGVSPSDAIR